MCHPDSTSPMTARSHASAHPTNELINRIAMITVVGCMLFFAAVLLRVTQLELHSGERLAAYAKDRISTRPVMGYRGEILDRRGRLLSTTRSGYRVFLDPEQIDLDTLDATIVELADILQVPAEDIGKRIVRAVSLNEQRRAAMPEDTVVQPDPLQALKDWIGRKTDSSRHTPVLPQQSTPIQAAGSPSVQLASVRSDNPAERSDIAVQHSDQPDADDAPEADPPLPLIRYVPLGSVLSEAQVASIKALDRKGVHLERLPVREYPGGPIVASLVGKVGVEQKGLVGAELKLNGALEASNGTARYVRDAQGRPLWIERGQWTAPTHGHSVRLSIDLELQRIAIEELTRGVEDADAVGGRLVMIDPVTGEILAMADIYRDVGPLPEFPWVDANADANAPGTPKYDPWEAPRYKTLTDDPMRKIHPALGRNRCVEDVYEPGSTFKPFVWSLLTSAGLCDPDEVFDTEGGRWLIRAGRGRRYIEDVTKRDRMTWSEVLINSSNIGMIKGASRMDHKALHDGIMRFGFGSKTGISLPGEPRGLITPLKRWTIWTQESVAFGHEVAVTPVQMARAFCAFATPGELAGTMPQVTLEAVGPDSGNVRVRAIPADIARLTRYTIRHVAEKVEQRMAQTNPDEPVDRWRYVMFGKSGTAEIPLGKPPKGKKRPRGSSGYYDNQYNSSFIAGAPLASPRLVVLVVIDDPGPELVHHRRHYGSRVAGPVCRRVLERALTYLGVPPDAPLQSNPDADTTTLVQ